MSTPNLKSVLVVEDDADIREIIQMSLETFGGLSVRVCASGQEAFQALATELPDLVLLDWMMPALDGGEVIARLRTDPRTARMPIVVLSGKALSNEIERMRAAGASEVISKPFDPVRLPERLVEIFAKASAEFGSDRSAPA